MSDGCVAIAVRRPAENGVLAVEAVDRVAALPGERLLHRAASS
jgi:hypothetical protein